jgi:hypothetical protein
MAQETTQVIYTVKDVIIDPTAVSEASAEAFATGSGKLATPDNADSFPVFDTTEVPTLGVEGLQDFDVVIVRDSEAVDAGTGAFKFSLYIASTGVEPPSGVYKANISIII